MSSVSSSTKYIQIPTFLKTPQENRVEVCLSTPPPHRKKHPTRPPTGLPPLSRSRRKGRLWGSPRPVEGIAPHPPGPPARRPASSAPRSDCCSLAQSRAGAGRGGDPVERERERDRERERETETETERERERQRSRSPPLYSFPKSFQ